MGIWQQKYTTKRQMIKCIFTTIVHTQKSQKDAVPYSLFIICKRICTEMRHFFMEVQDITQKLAHRGYPHELIVKSFLKAKRQNRDDLLAMEKENSTADKKIRLITTYNTHNPPMKDILQRYKDYFIQN